MTTEWLNPPHRRWIARITIPHSDDDETVVQWGTWTRWGARRKTRSALALIHPNKRGAVTIGIQKAARP